MALDLFSKRPIQTDIEEVSYVNYYPLVNPNGSSGPIEFFIPGNMLYYLDLKDASLAVQVKVLKKPGEDLTAADNVAPVNNWLHSLFSDITLTMNDTVVEGGTHLYPYKAYLTNLLMYGDEAKKCQLQTSGWAKDQAGAMENAANTGYVTRKAWVKESTTYYMEGPLLLDMFMQGKLLINQVDLRLKLTRSSNAFQLLALGGGAAKEAQVVIVAAHLKIKQVHVSPDRARQIESSLTLQNAIYPIQRTEMYTYSIPSGMQSSVRENLFHNRRPKMLLITLVPNKDFNGDIETNPFNFRHCKLNFLALYIDGKPIPHIPLTPDFENFNYVDIYRNLQQFVGLHNHDGDIGITKNDFLNGYTLFSYILAQDGQSTAQVGQPLVNGNIRIEMRFKTALTKAINVVCMAVYDDEVQISRLRKVSADYMT